MTNLWDAHLSSLLDHDCQSVLGNAGGGPTPYTIAAAKSGIIPNFYRDLIFRLKNPISIKPEAARS